LHDQFCPKCGLELCAPEGTPKRKLQPLPASVEMCLPFVDSFLKQELGHKAKEMLDYLLKENPDHPECLKRRNILAKMP